MKISNILTNSFIIIIIINSCNPDTEKSPSQYELKMIDYFDLTLTEPSGLTFGNTPESLYLVTDSPNSRVHKIDYNGNVLVTFDFNGDDLEAIAFNSIDSTLWVSEESLLQLVQLDIQGHELDRIELDYPNNFNDLRIEGLTINHTNNCLILLNEKDPGAIIEMDLESLTINNIYYLNFASDYSAICYAEDIDSYIILSDEDQSVFLWNIENGAKEIYDTGYPKAEGVVKISNYLFITSEEGNRLYRYLFQ